MNLTLSFRRDWLGQKWIGRILPANAGIFWQNGSKISADEAASQMLGKRGLCLICGYNSSSNGAQQSYDTILAGLKAVGVEYEFVIFVQWPTSTKPAYWYAEEKVYWDGLPGKWDDGVGNRLRDVLKKLPFLSLDVIAHSLGNGVILDALRGADVYGIRNLFLTNAAVTASSVCLGHPFAPSVEHISGKAVVLFSRRDEVLGIVFRAAKFGEEALGYDGPPKDAEIGPSVECVDATAWCASHSDARNHPEYYIEMAKRIKAQSAVA